MSKLQRTEANLHLPEHQPSMEDAAHPRKSPLGQIVTTVSAEEGKSSPSGSRHPLAHRVKILDDVWTSCYKSKFLPYSDSRDTGDVYFQPRSITNLGKKWVDAQVEVFVNGSDEVKRDLHEYTLLATDLLRMIYLCEKADAVYYNIDIEEYDLWKVHRYSELMEENRSLAMDDEGSMADLLMKKKEFPFALGRGSHLEVYFQLHFVHEYTTAKDCVKAKNPNTMICHASGKGKFDYCIEARIFVLSDEIHERKLGDMFEETQRV